MSKDVTATIRTVPKGDARYSANPDNLRIVCDRTEAFELIRRLLLGLQADPLVNTCQIGLICTLTDTIIPEPDIDDIPF